MTRSRCAVARLSVGAATILFAVTLLAVMAPDASAAVLPITAQMPANGYGLADFLVQASPVLLSLRAKAVDLEVRASAKMAVCTP